MKNWSEDRGANLVAGAFGIAVAIILYKNGYLDFLWREREVEGYQSGTLASVLVASLIDIVALIGAVLLTASGYLLKNLKSGILFARKKIEESQGDSVAPVVQGGSSQPVATPNITEMGRAVEYLLEKDDENEGVYDAYLDLKTRVETLSDLIRGKLFSEGVDDGKEV